MCIPANAQCGLCSSFERAGLNQNYGFCAEYHKYLCQAAKEFGIFPPHYSEVSYLQPHCDKWRPSQEYIDGAEDPNAGIDSLPLDRVQELHMETGQQTGGRGW